MSTVASTSATSSLARAASLASRARRAPALLRAGPGPGPGRGRRRRLRPDRAAATTTSASASATSSSDGEGGPSDASKTLRLKAEAIAKDLKGVTVTFVGDSEGANDAVGGALASALGYVPLSTPDLVEKITGQTRAEIVESDGEGGLVIEENAVFEQLSTQLRCVISTSGGGKGASARGACWDYLFGHFVIWLDDVDAAAAAAADPAAAPQREAYEFADAHLVMSTSEVKTQEEAIGIASQVVAALGELLAGDEQLAGKKTFYNKMGCRGDWPTLQPPGWDGTKEGMVDPATGKPYRDAAA